jgi:hypothetical protein
MHASRKPTFVERDERLAKEILRSKPVPTADAGARFGRTLMLGPATGPSQRVIALDGDTLLGAKRRSRASGFVLWTKGARRRSGR